MFKKIAEKCGFISDSFDALVEKELQSPLAQLYFGLSPSPLNDKRSFLDEMDKYVQLSQSNPQALYDAKLEKEELELTLLFDIFRVINKRPYTEGDTLVFSKQALKDYTDLPEAKKTLFRTSLLEIPHKQRVLSPSSIQKIKE